jgi:DNA-binding NarL/FixJ family response regulator
VDDFERWRAFTLKTLKNMPELDVVGEVSDGLEAVRQVENLRPDLVLLDITLPTLSGIEAARRIQQVAPESKILFVTENQSPEIAEAAMSTGALGYVIKSDASSELLPAIRAVLEGKRFISASLAGQFVMAATLSTTSLSWVLMLISGLR